MRAPDPCDEWPTWLPLEGFTEWCKSENRLRELAGDEPLPPVPTEVGQTMLEGSLDR